jgi:hypothetical protein
MILADSIADLYLLQGCEQRHVYTAVPRLPVAAAAAGHRLVCVSTTVPGILHTPSV